MKLDFINKSKIAMCFAILCFCFSPSNVSYAETLQNIDLNTSESPVKIANCECPDKNQVNTEIPAVDIKKTEINEDKNIVPVLDLKGGVQTQEIKKETPVEIWLNQDTMTGNWNGLRSKAEEHGITVSGSYMLNNFMKEHSGGLLNNSRPSYQGISNTSIEFNTEKMHLYPGGKLFVQFQNIHGKGLTDKYVGDYMYFNG